MFKLNAFEQANLKSQFVTSSWTEVGGRCQARSPSRASQGKNWVLQASAEPWHSSGYRPVAGDLTDIPIYGYWYK